MIILKFKYYKLLFIIKYYLNQVSMSDIVTANQDENNTNLIQNKKSRGRPKLTEDEKQKRKEKLKAYSKEYREQNKEKIANYESRKYNENTSQIMNKRHIEHVKKYKNIVNIIKYLYFNGLINITDSIKETELKLLLENCKKNI